MSSHNSFFQTIVPEALTKLNADSEKIWGVMSATQMLEHVLAITRLILSKQHVALVIPEEKLPRYRAFLMSDKPFGQNLLMPEEYQKLVHNDRLTLAELKIEFLKELENFNHQSTTDPDFWMMHPTFGKLDAEGARQLQYKHLSHHFTQFDLL